MVEIQKAKFIMQDGKLVLQGPDCEGIPTKLHMDSDYLLECLNCQQTLIRYTTPEELAGKLEEVLRHLLNAL
jgi:hypothetical protein